MIVMIGSAFAEDWSIYRKLRLSLSKKNLIQGQTPNHHLWMHSFEVASTMIVSTQLIRRKLGKIQVKFERILSNCSQWFLCYAIQIHVGEWERFK